MDNPRTDKFWRCFHCGEEFTDRVAAQEHFGLEMDTTPACKLGGLSGLVKIIRDQEEELRRYRQEDTETSRQFYALGAEHYQKLQRAEEEGYRKGVRDAAPNADIQRENIAKIKPGQIWRHKERRTVYMIGEINASLQCSTTPEFEHRYLFERWVVYFGAESPPGSPRHLRPLWEFCDGRFELVS